MLKVARDFLRPHKETEEESSITDLDFKWGKRPIIVDQLKVYLAETSQPGKVVANEHSGILDT